jgi:hypothetical protein
VDAVESQALSHSEGLYFFLSHGHDAGDISADRDHWVSAVYHDLVEEIGKRPRAMLGWQLGEFGSCNAAERDTPMPRSALETASVFVALYSYSYLRDDRAMAERATFAAVADRSAGRHILPVVWEPAREDAAAPDLDDAVAIAPEIPEYAETGLLALSRLRQSRKLYRAVLAFLGEWIVNVADGRQPPAGRGRPTITPAPAKPQTAFVVTVFARPATGRLAAVAQRLAGLVDRIAYDVVVTDFTGSAALVDSPGLLLVDARTVDSADAELERILADVPKWVIPVAVGARAGSAPTDGLWSRVTLLGEAAGTPRPRIEHASPDPFDASARGLIEQAVRRYEPMPFPSRQLRPFPARIRILDANREEEARG